MFTIFVFSRDHFVIQSRGTLRRRSGKKLLSHHLYFCMRDFGYLIGDDAEVFFYLYDGTPGAMRQISERFSVFIPKDGYTHFNEKIHTNCCVFTDLGKNFLLLLIIKNIFFGLLKQIELLSTMPFFPCK